VPYCLQPLIREKPKALVGAVEMDMYEKEHTPLEYRGYVKERDIKSEKD
jgi:hypothetical protein